MKKIIAALIVACASFACQAQACEKVEIQVLPFTVQTNFDKTMPELVKLGLGGEVGMVLTRSSTTFKDCKLTVGFKDPVLYVASELKANRCAFNHVLNHEQEHVRIYQAGLAKMEDKLKARIEAGEHPFKAGEAEIAAIRAQHQTFDSPEEYALNETVCRKQIVALTGN